MSSSESKARANRRERRKARSSGWRRHAKAKVGRAGHGPAGSRMLGGPARVRIRLPRVEIGLTSQNKSESQSFCFGDVATGVEVLESMGYYKREKVKESTFGSYQQVKQIATCYHRWSPRPAILFGYMHVEAQCTECKTWWGGSL